MTSITSLCSPTTHSFKPFLRTRRIVKPSSSKNKEPNNHLTKTYATRRDGDRNFFDGRIVDENMIVLRKRIHETKIIEEGFEHLPVEWMDWERRLHADNYYGSLICDALLHLQTCLMETRPSLVLGAIAAIALCVPASIAVVLYNLWIHGIFH